MKKLIISACNAVICVWGCVKALCIRIVPATSIECEEHTLKISRSVYFVDHVVNDVLFYLLSDIYPVRKKTADKL